MEKIKEYKGIIIIVLIIIFGISLIVENNRFPVKLKNCDLFYKDCSIVAKFKDFSSCEIVKERYSWFCDITDPSNLLCRKAKAGESSVVSICMK